MAKRTYADYYKDYYSKNQDKMREYKRNYETNVRRKNCTRIEAFIPKEKAEQLKNKLSKEGLSIAEFIRNKVDEYINKKD